MRVDEALLPGARHPLSRSAASWWWRPRRKKFRACISCIERGIANGVERMRLLDRDEFREIEPHCDGICALHVPSTGIVDYTEVAKKYAELIERAGGEIVFRAKVTGLRDDGDANIVETTAGSVSRELRHQLRRTLQRHHHPHGGLQDRPRDHSLPRRVLRGEARAALPGQESDLSGARSALPVPRRALHAPRERQRRSRSQRAAGVSPRRLHRQHQSI